MPDSVSARLPALIPLVLAASLAQPALAQSSCASDGQKRPGALVERFINADCATCWTDPAAAPARRGAVALDWVLPGRRGEDAPLSAVATRDALNRLEVLGKAPPAASLNLNTPVQGQKGTLRVAHGLPVSGYIGASIAFKGMADREAGQPWSAWLALVEALPVGTEGSPVSRNLVRNLVQVSWDGRGQLSKQEQIQFTETRSMDVPAGTNTGRLRVIGWVQDARGRIVTAAQSRCVGK